MNSDVTKSKFLSLVLRHDPSSIDLQLDGHGWASVAELIAKSPVTLELSRDDVLRIVAESEKKRFALSPDQLRIRANQGHSVSVDLGLTPKDPPPHLYHGTASRFIPSILREGLIKVKRHHVHLSESIETASIVGVRHGALALLIIDAARMSAAGHAFYISENGVWLTDSVPIDYLQIAEV